MKIVTLFVLIIASHSVFAEGYSPFTKSHEHFKGHYLYPAFNKAIKSKSIAEAVANWESFIGEAQISDDPKGLEDITQYEMYKRGLSELTRVYYLSGNISKGDEALMLQEAISITETPSKTLLGKMCKREFPDGF